MKNKIIVYGGFLICMIGLIVLVQEVRNPEPLTLGLSISGAPTGALPDPNLTPGEKNPNVTQANIQQTICKSGWTATIRPSVSDTNFLKRSQMTGRKLPGSMADYEEDHLISLELGGSPTDPKNLWPEAYPMARQKDRTETYLKNQVCSGAITLAAAQSIISTNWYAEWQKVFGGKNLGALPTDFSDTDDEGDAPAQAGSISIQSTVTVVAATSTQ